MISLLQSASFFLVHFVTVLFERFKLISSDVSSLFLLDIECFKLIRRFKPIFSCHIKERFKLISLSISSSFHQMFQAYFFLISDVIEADSLSIRAYYTHVAELVSFVSTTRM